jgi:hypothetical protein
VPTSTYHSLATNPPDQVKTPKLELNEDNMEEELEEYYKVEEELVNVIAKSADLTDSGPLMATPSVWSTTLLRSASTSCSTRRWRSPSTLR